MDALSATASGPRLATPVRISEQVWSEGTVPVVTIRCITYNHAKFIRDAIEGFLMQETTFPVEILIHDDASTDGTAEIIREYEAKHPQLFRTVLQKENQYSKGREAWNRVREHNWSLTRGEFVASCEGDDYWTAPSKLQRQVDYLSTHLDYHSCFHFVESVDGKGVSYGATLYGAPTIKASYDVGDLLLHGTIVPTASLVFRAAIVREVPKWVRDCPIGDLPLNLILMLRSRSGQIGLLPYVMGAYRTHVGGLYGGSTLVQSARLTLNAFLAIECCPELSAHPAWHKGVQRRVNELLDAIAKELPLRSAIRQVFAVPGIWRFRERVGFIRTVLTQKARGGNALHHKLCLRLLAFLDKMTPKDCSRGQAMQHE